MVILTRKEKWNPMEVRSQKSEVRSQKSEVRSQKGVRPGANLPIPAILLE
jgi:hypothetical protein